MTDLRKAAKQALEAYDKHEPLAVVMEELRAALEQPEQEPQPCPTCEALARTVMMDQTSHDTHPPQRKLLTGEQIEFAWIKAMQSTPGTTLPIHEFARAIEQAHGIKGEV